MKRIILAVLMAVIVTTPCFAQEIETDGLFSLHGTLWKALPVGIQIFPFPLIWDTNGLEIGFYGGKGYIDMLVFSIFSTRNSLLAKQGAGAQFTSFSARNSISPSLTAGGSINYFGILQPIGIGIVVERYVSTSPGVPARLAIGFLIKISDDWTPPEIE